MPARPTKGSGDFSALQRKRKPPSPSWPPPLQACPTFREEESEGIPLPPCGKSREQFILHSVPFLCGSPGPWNAKPKADRPGWQIKGAICIARLSPPPSASPPPPVPAQAPSLSSILEREICKDTCCPFGGRGERSSPQRARRHCCQLSREAESIHSQFAKFISGAVSLPPQAGRALPEGTEETSNGSRQGVGGEQGNHTQEEGNWVVSVRP